MVNHLPNYCNNDLCEGLGRPYCFSLRVANFPWTRQRTGGRQDGFLRIQQESQDLHDIGSL